MPALLHCHSYYSFEEALPSPGQLAQAARDCGYPSLAQTDTLSLSGAVEFYLACQQVGVRPILGLTVHTAPEGGTLTLLAMNRAGWSSLCRLVSARLLQEDSSGNLIELHLLQQHAAGLLCLTGGRRSALQRRLAMGAKDEARQGLAQLADCFPGRLYVELAGEAPAEEACIELARELCLPLAASPEVFSLTPAQDDLLRTLNAIRSNLPRRQLPAEAQPQQPHFPNRDELAARFAHCPEALQGADEAAARCTAELPLGEAHYPQVALPPGKSALDVLRSKAYQGAQHLYGTLTPEIEQRLEHELSVIGGQGYEVIFLIVEELLNYARQQGVPTSSRGSAASSLVAHCLSITSPDPLRLNLYFERFLNPSRSTPPDIDTDLCSRRRDQVIQHVFDTYGSQHAAMVGTINRFRPRSALSDAAKAHGFTPDEVRRLVNGLPRWFHPGAAEEDDPIRQNPYHELSAQYPDARHQLLFSQAQALIGLPRYLSVHPGGVVITPEPLTDLIPLQHSGTKGVTISQFDLEPLERMGLVKIDLLGIRGLTVLGDVAEAIYSWRSSEFHTRLEVLEEIKNDDAETIALLKACATIGCFQIESPGMRATLREIGASSVDDLMAALALYRPGPLKGGLKDAFVRRHRGEEAVLHLHPALAPLLNDTYGVILYQEQVLRIAHELAGLSLAEADLLRRAMSHFDPGKQMQTLQEHFIAGAWQHSQVDPQVGARLWEMMAAFAGYGFPKAHAASYAQLAWRLAWCKAHFPAEFMAAVLANWGGYYSQRVYLSEARRMGLSVLPPHINHARPEFSVAYPQGQAVLYMGLDQVRDLTRQTQKAILRGRPFRGLADFLARVDPRRSEANALVRVGALRGLGTIPGLLRQLEQESWSNGQLSLFDWSQSETEDWSLSQKIAAQEELLGVGVDAHPLELYADAIAAAGALTTLQAIERNGQPVRVAGMRQTSHRSRTARGEHMLFLTLEDLEGMLDVVFFPQAYRQARTLLSGPGPFLIEGVMETDSVRLEPYLRAERVQRL